jgi:hypothetical protein
MLLSNTGGIGTAVRTRPAAQTETRFNLGPVLAAAMRFKCRRAVWADDSQVLKAIVRWHAIDVVKNQRDPAFPPDLVLPAQLAPALLQATGVEATLEGGAAVVRIRHQHSLQRHRVRRTRVPVTPKVFGRQTKTRDVLLQRDVITTGRTKTQDPQSRGQAERTGDRRSDIVVCVGRGP